MTIRTINDPSGLNAELVERLVGLTAYDIVKMVAANLIEINAVAPHLEAIDLLAPQASALAALGPLDEAIAVLGEMDEELAVLYSIRANLITVANNNASVVAVADAIASVIALAPRVAELQVLAPKATAIGQLGPVANAIQTVADSSTALLVVAADIALGANVSNILRAVASSTAAIAAMNEARAARDQVFHAITSGIPGQYATNAAMIADIANIPADELVQVLKDEKKANHRTLYKKVSGVMEFQFDFQAQEIGFRKSAQRSRARCALIFDDGYDNNLTVAAPILAKYGFAATTAIEASRAGYLYNGSVNHRVFDGADLRALINLGWEVANHPFLDINASEQVMVETARYENQLIRDLLTGSKVPKSTAPAIGFNGPNNPLNFDNATPTNPEFANYEVRGAIYQGGLRNNLSDLAYRAVPYRYIRSISGTESSAGKVQNAARDDGRFGIHWSPARVIDTNGSATALRDVLNYLRGLAETGQDGLLYGHFTPNITAGNTPPGSFQPPWVPVDHLETICQLADSLGVQIVPMSALGSPNVLEDPALVTGASVAFTGANSGYDTTVTLNGSPRSARIQTATASGNITTHSVAWTGIRVRPFTWYRFRFRYRIDTDLVLSGGSGNTNHGLGAQITTVRGDAPGTNDAGIDEYTIQRYNNASYARRYAATSGEWLEADFELFTTSGMLASVAIGLLNATGTVYIGAASLERLESLRERPLTGTVATYNTTAARQIVLPASTDGLWEFDFDIIQDAYVHGTHTNSVTVDYAAVDPSEIPALTDGQTVYVLGKGSGTYAGKGGQIGTWNTSAFTWSNPGNMSIIKAANAQGIVNQYFMHLQTSTHAELVMRMYGNPAWQDTGIVNRTSAAIRNIYNRSGKRSDPFTWIARPKLLRNIP